MFQKVKGFSELRQKNLEEAKLRTWQEKSANAHNRKQYYRKAVATRFSGELTSIIGEPNKVNAPANAA